MRESMPEIDAATERAALLGDAHAPRRRADRGRFTVIAMLIVSLVATGFMQHIGQRERSALVQQTGTNAGTNVSNLNSYSLALFLSGLRGPLVMALWSSSESQKTEHNLEDFDTKVELIRLLQPEFDSVHLFQIWNKAYNVGAMMTSLPNKYSACLGGLEYGMKIDEQRPDNINIVSAIGDVYFNKMANSTERHYYDRRVECESFQPVKVIVPADREAEFRADLRRADSAEEEADIRTAEGSAGKTLTLLTDHLTANRLKYLMGEGAIELQPQVWSPPSGRELPVRLVPMLDDQGHLLPDLVRPLHGPPAGLAPGREFCDGSQLQYLTEFAPYPFGLSPFGLGYNYYKRAQVLKDSTRQKHLQVSDLMIDKEPGLCLMLWAEGEWDQAVRLEIDAMGMKQPQDNDNKGYVGVVTANMRLKDPMPKPGLVPEILYRYQMVQRLDPACHREYQLHLTKYLEMDRFLVQSHLDELDAIAALAAADEAYLRAKTGDASQLPVAKKLYQAAATHFQMLMIRYAAISQDYRKFYPEGFGPGNAETMSPEQIQQTFERFMAGLKNGEWKCNDDHRNMYTSFLFRCNTRLNSLAE